jgi:hypothetical protein
MIKGNLYRRNKKKSFPFCQTMRRYKHTIRLIVELICAALGRFDFLRPIFFRIMQRTIVLRKSTAPQKKRIDLLIINWL